MNLNFKAIAALCSVAVSLTSGCRSLNTVSDMDENSVSPMFPYGETQESFLPETATAKDFEQPEEAELSVVFGADGIEADGDGIEVQGYAAVIGNGGVYRISGSMDGGRVVVDCDEEVSLILDDVSIQSIDSIGSADIKLTIPESSGSTLSGDVRSGGISLIGDLTINGGGALAIGGGSGISCGALKLCGGDIRIDSANNGITGERYVVLAGGSVEIHSEAVGICIENSNSAGYINITGGVLNVTSGADGISTDSGVYISNGSVDVSGGGGSGAVLHFGRGQKHPVGKHGGFATDGSSDFDFDDLISGDGSRVVSKKGINTNGVIEISGGVLIVDSADDSLSARSGVEISGGTLELSSGDDGIHCDSDIVVADGDVTIHDSYIALEGLSVTVLGGDLSLTSYYDGINAAGGNNIQPSGSANSSAGKYVSISGGKVYINAGGDGIDSAGTAAISGGEVTVFAGIRSKFASLNYNDSFALSGGTLAAFGSDGLTKAPSIVSNSCISVYADAEENTVIAIKNSSDDIVFETVMSSECASVIFSCEDIVIGEEYRIYADGILLKSVVAEEGVCGGGPSGRDTGIFDNVTSGSQSGAGELVA